MSKHTFNMTIDLGDFGEQEVEVQYSYSAGRPAVMYLRNGDPGYPEEPAELEVLKVFLGKLELPSFLWETEHAQNVIIDKLSAYHSEDY